MTGSDVAARGWIRSAASTGVALAIALAVVLSSPTERSDAAELPTGSLPVPRPEGMTVGFAGSRIPEEVVAAQPFAIESLSMFSIPLQRWYTYVPGAPTFANTLTSGNLRGESIVFAKRTASSALTGSAVPIAGAPLVPLPEIPSPFIVPPPDGLTLGVAGTTDPAALIGAQFFQVETINAWDVAAQRYRTYIPGAPAIVNTLTAANLAATDILWLKAKGGATGAFVAEDTPFVARLVPFGDAGTLLSVGAAQHGEVIDNGDGSVTYVPEKNFFGEDSFSYTVQTPTGPEIRTFRIVVTGENDAPIANDDAAVAEATGVTLIDVLKNDVDPDKDPMRILKTTQPAHGIVAVAGTRLAYTPEPKFSGVDVFQYEVTDGIAPAGEAPESVATVFIAVGGAALAGPPPIGGGGGGGGGTGGSGGGDGEGGSGAGAFLADDSAHLPICEATAIDVLGNDPGDGVTVLVIASVSVPALGSAADNGDGSITYTPSLAPEDCAGVDSFTYSVPDGDGVEQTATVTVTLGEAAGGSGENQAPAAADDSAATLENQPVVIDLLANDSDPDGDALTVIEVTQPAGGSVVDHGDGTVTYSANGYTGQATFGYTISDGQGGEASASVSVTVEAGPVSPNGPVTVAAGGQVTIQVVNPSSFVQLESVTNGSHGSTTMSVGAGTVTYRPDAGYTGDDWITWTLRFSHGGSSQTTLHILVGG